MSLSISRTFVSYALALVAVVGATVVANADVFFTETFDAYDDGPLVSGSGGLWTTHSGTADQMQVAGGEAVVKLSEAEDVSAPVGQVIAEGGTWYFGAKIKVNAGTSALSATPNYFLHLKDEGTFSFRTRIYLKPANTPSDTTYSFGMSAGSLTGGGALVPWTAGDFTFGDEVILVGRYTSADGVAETPDEGFGQLWVNPANQASSSIIDSNPNPSNITDDSMSRIALREPTAAGQPDILVNVLAVGDDFDDVLAALATGPGEFDVADFNEDGDVDGTDLQTIIDNFGTGSTKAQGNATLAGDADVDGADVLVWQQNAVIPQFGAVPEPATAVLLVAGLAGFVRRRR